MYSKRWLFVIVIYLLTILLYPTSASAISCLPSSVRYIAECEDGKCADGFRVQERFTGNGCDQLPYVVDLEEYDRIGILFEYMFRVKQIEDHNGVFELKGNIVCAWEIMHSKQADTISKNCGENSAYITLHNLSDTQSELTLNDWRRRIEKESFITRVSYAVRYISIGILIFGIVIVVPFLIVRQRVNDNQPLQKSQMLIAIQSILVVIVLLGGIFFSFYSDWIFWLNTLILIGIFAEIVYILKVAYIKQYKGPH